MLACLANIVTALHTTECVRKLVVVWYLTFVGFFFNCHDGERYDDKDRDETGRNQSNNDTRGCKWSQLSRCCFKKKKELAEQVNETTCWDDHTL